MPATSDVWWDTCAQDDCIGARLPTGDRCWAHADEQELDAALQRLGDMGVLDARGVPITADLLARLLAAAPRDPKRPGHPFLAKAMFDRATFSDDAEFRSTTGVTFGRASFADATFGDRANFAEAVFDDAKFSGATFGDRTNFYRVTFGDRASFARVTFGDRASFDWATFGDHTRFDAMDDDWTSINMTFGNDARFDHATFGDHTRFQGATFGDRASFHHATFGDHASFMDATFGDVRFEGATFGDLTKFGPILVTRMLDLKRATFGRSPDLTVSADLVRCQQARFPDGVYLRIRWAEIRLDGVHFGQPSVLTKPSSEAFGSKAAAVERFQAAWRPHRTERPRPVSLAECNLDNLVMDGCDLRACSFTGAHSLAALRLEGATMLPSTPQGWRRGRALPPVWRWGPRQTIAEEHYWRQHQPKGAGWREASHAAGGDVWSYPSYPREHGAPVGPAEIAAVYRALRKGREDSKDEPGAADFYYGEMEMRRHARRLDTRAAWKDRQVGHWIASAAEHAILTLYWLVSGYGLRAWRALATLLAILLAASIGFAFWGFAAPEAPSRPVRIGPAGDVAYAQPPTAARPAGIDELPEAVRFAARSATALLRGPERPLTPFGEWLEITVRLLGPVLLGLAILSVRARVKR